MGVLILPIHDLPLQLGFNQLTGLLPAAWSSSNVRPPVELPLIGELGWAIEVSKPKPVLSLNARYRATCATAPPADPHAGAVQQLSDWPCLPTRLARTRCHGWPSRAAAQRCRRPHRHPALQPVLAQPEASVRPLPDAFAQPE